VIDRELAVAIAFAAAPWLGKGSIVTAKQALFADVRYEYAPRPSQSVPGDRVVWAINLFDQGMQQGALLAVDATDGRVIQMQRLIR
jgi:hypothetical protein